jgi:predicted P-loop ATPase
MSRRVDHYRPSYGVRSQDFARQCVFIGSTNADTYLADETGGRRFWPVKVGTIDIESLTRDREQLWAEAVVAYRASERWWLDAEVEKAARGEQEERHVSDPWEPHVLKWIADKSAASVAEVLEHAIGMPRERQDQRAMNRVAAVLGAAGWKPTRRRVGGERVRFYERPAEDQTRDSSEDTRDTSETSAEAAPGRPYPGQAASVPGAGTYTRDKKASNHAGVPGAFSAHTHTRTHTHAALSENGWDTRDTQDSAPPWTDDREWIDRYRRALGREGRVAIVLAWGEAAGGTVQDGEPPGLTLPPYLPKGLSLAELRRLARDVKVQVAP